MNPRQIVFVIAVVAVGIALGGLYGMQQDPGYRTTHSVALDETVRAGNQSSTRVVTFIARLDQDPIREQAAETTSTPPGRFGTVFGRRVDDSMLVEIELRTADPAGAPERLDALIEAALLAEIEAERATEQIVVDTARTEVASLDDELAEIFEAVDLAPGSDLGDQRERDQFNLISAEAQLAALPEDETYWNVRLPGDIEAYKTRIASIDLQVDRWREIVERRSDLADTYDRSLGRLVELDAADDIALAGTTVLRGSPEAISVRATAGRWAALVGLASFAAALLVVAAGSVIDRPARTHARSERTSAPAAP